MVFAWDTAMNELMDYAARFLNLSASLSTVRTVVIMWTLLYESSREIATPPIKGAYSKSGKQKIFTHKDGVYFTLVRFF